MSSNLFIWTIIVRKKCIKKNKVIEWLQFLWKFFEDGISIEVEYHMTSSLAESKGFLEDFMRHSAFAMTQY